MLQASHLAAAAGGWTRASVPGLPRGGTEHATELIDRWGMCLPGHHQRMEVSVAEEDPRFSTSQLRYGYEKLDLRTSNLNLTQYSTSSPPNWTEHQHENEHIRGRSIPPR
jgi:hypothetical protein